MLCINELTSKQALAGMPYSPWNDKQQREGDLARMRSRSWPRTWCMASRLVSIPAAPFSPIRASSSTCFIPSSPACTNSPIAQQPHHPKAPPLNSPTTQRQTAPAGITQHVHAKSTLCLSETMQLCSQHQPCSFMYAALPRSSACLSTGNEMKG